MTALVMTEAERRRAAGEAPFGEFSPCVTAATGDLHWDGRAYLTKDRIDCVAALLRALVLQQLLVTFSPPWTEVSP